MRQRPDLRAKLADGSALIGTIDTYLIYRLTGGSVFATDATNASRTLLYNITDLAWDEELCALWEVPRCALAEVRDCSAHFGETTLGGALARPIALCGVMGDSQASLFAQRCFAPGATKVTFGTGSSLLMTIGSQPRLSDSGVLTALAWVHDGVPTYAFEGIIISSASTLTWLRDQIGLAPDVPAIERLAIAAGDNGGVYLVPAFTGLGLPHWNSAVRAAIVGLSSHSDRRHLARAAFESIAFQLRDALDALRVEAQVQHAVLRADGGPTASGFLMQLCADIAGVELSVPDLADCSPYGAVLAGQLGQRCYGSLDEIVALGRAETVYRPAMPAEHVAALRAGWNRSVHLISG